jgi:aminoglycoside N3'-acetyltransferase
MCVFLHPFDGNTRAHSKESQVALQKTFPVKRAVNSPTKPCKHYCFRVDVNAKDFMGRTRFYALSHRPADKPKSNNPDFHRACYAFLF